MAPGLANRKLSSVARTLRWPRRVPVSKSRRFGSTVRRSTSEKYECETGYDRNLRGAPQGFARRRWHRRAVVPLSNVRSKKPPRPMRRKRHFGNGAPERGAARLLPYVAAMAWPARRAPDPHPADASAQPDGSSPSQKVSFFRRHASRSWARGQKRFSRPGQGSSKVLGGLNRGVPIPVFVTETSPPWSAVTQLIPGLRVSHSTRPDWFSPPPSTARGPRFSAVPGLLAAPRAQLSAPLTVVDGLLPNQDAPPRVASLTRQDPQQRSPVPAHRPHWLRQTRSSPGSSTNPPTVSPSHISRVIDGAVSPGSVRTAGHRQDAIGSSRRGGYSTA